MHVENATAVAASPALLTDTRDAAAVTFDVSNTSHAALSSTSNTSSLEPGIYIRSIEPAVFPTDGTATAFLFQGPTAEPLLKGHGDRVSSIAITPDGTRAVSASDDVALWSFEDRTRIATLRGHSNGVRCVACTPDGRFVVSADVYGNLLKWDLDMHSCIAGPKKHGTGIYGSAVAASLVVLGNEDGVLRLLDPNFLGCVAALKCGADGRIKSVAVSLNSRYALCGDGGNQLHL